jgi:hypothetical protein
MSKLENNKGHKLKYSKIFLYTTLLISFHLTGCGDKAAQPNDTKSIKIEITAPNETKSDPKSKDKSKGLNVISGIKIGDPINRIDIVFGIDTSTEKWEEITPGIYNLFIIREFYGERNTLHIHIFKNKANTIKAIACGLRFPDQTHYGNGGTVGEIFFTMNRSKCDGEIVKLFSPVFSPQSILSETNINQNFGEPLNVKKLEPKPFFLTFPKEEEMKILEYKNTFLYTHLDRVLGMAIFDDDFKKSWIDKIEAGFIK